MNKNQDQKTNENISPYAQYPFRGNLINQQQVHQNLEKNGVETKKQSIRTKILVGGGLFICGFIYLYILIGALEQKFNREPITGLGNPEDRFAYKDEQWWE